MARYRVFFDERWQGEFDQRHDALNWGSAVAETGRLVWVVRFTFFRTKLVAVFPMSRAEEGSRLWKVRGGGVGG